MLREGHLGVGMAMYAPIGFVAYVVGFRELAFIGGAAVALLAMLPDQDIRVPLVKHRGVTHTVWFALLVGLGGAVLGAAYGTERGILAVVGTSAFGFVVGTTAIGSHIVADALTPMGVTPFSPYDRTRYTYRVASASNPIANYVLLVVGGGIALGALLLASALVG